MDTYNHRWVFLFAVGNPETWAITIGPITFYSCSASQVSDTWRRHEDKHKEQWRRGWYIGFAVKYLYFNARYGYWNNPYEVEARAAEKG